MTIHNMHWKAIRPTDRVELTSGRYMYVITRDGKQYIANWSSFDATDPERFLMSRLTEANDE